MDDFLFFNDDNDINEGLQKSIDDLVESSNERDDAVPEDCILNVKYTDGKKQGPATIKTKKGIMYAKLNYQDDKLNGYCIFNDLYGKKRFEGYYENGVKDGWGCEYDNNRKCVFTGFYRDGKRYCKLTPVPGKDNFYHEIIDGKRIAICQYTKTYRRHGICYLFNDTQVSRVSLFEQGLEMRVLKEFEGPIMKEYNANNRVIYEGEFQNHLLKDYPRSGQGEEYSSNGNLIYHGNWRDNKRNGFGDSYNNGYLYYSGYWKNGVVNGHGELFNADGDTVYKGNWNQGILVTDDNKRIDFRTGKELKPSKSVPKEAEKGSEKEPENGKEKEVGKDKGKDKSLPVEAPSESKGKGKDKGRDKSLPVEAPSEPKGKGKEKGKDKSLPVEAPSESEGKGKKNKNKTPIEKETQPNAEPEPEPVPEPELKNTLSRRRSNKPIQKNEENTSPIPSVSKRNKNQQKQSAEKPVDLSNDAESPFFQMLQQTDMEAVFIECDESDNETNEEEVNGEAPKKKNRRNRRGKKAKPSQNNQSTEVEMKNEDAMKDIYNVHVDTPVDKEISTPQLILKPKAPKASKAPKVPKGSKKQKKEETTADDFEIFIPELAHFQS